MTVTIYTDGACKNPKGGTGPQLGMGGWAWWVNDNYWDAGSVPETTNNRMEVLAVIQALAAAKIHRTNEPLLIVSDSAYTVGCFHDRWYERWIDNGWLNSAGKPVKNRDLWERLLENYHAHVGIVTFRHCRGHGRGGPADAPYVAGNHKADRLAYAARKALETGAVMDNAIMPGWMA